MVWLLVLIFVLVYAVTLMLFIWCYSKQKSRCKMLDDKLKYIRDMNHKNISEIMSINRKICCINFDRRIANENIVRNDVVDLIYLIEQIKREFGAEIAEKCVEWRIFDDPENLTKIVKGQLYYVKED